jgi:hypothetical protein
VASTAAAVFEFVEQSNVDDQFAHVDDHSKSANHALS